ncbi:hypothetical protein DAEQUDRAFT_717868 [Daedalea quercina L-15889]|uniref:Uncharacterized protein n=1 Tax=Daedalea quercina L-15889 TaxID=1314783 RepID=A0A165LKL4_9APHY|nr:hypothetical protein DAEQUDRAFT_717868 [Daedalea quercina L-15889]
MADVEYSHDDFEVVRTDPRFGGFEELKLKDGSTQVYAECVFCVAREADIMVCSSELKTHVLKDGQSGAAHPIYTHEGRKWILLSLPDEHYQSSVLAAGGKEQTKTLKGSDRISSREAVGLWKVNNRSWKVYATTSQLGALTADYDRAQIDAGLPVGTPAPAFQQGSVKQGSKRATEGFVMIAQWMEGANFQKTTASFKAALTKEKISHDKTSTDYKRIEAGCNAAKTIGLKDCQGFIKKDINEPVRFVDVHTSWNAQTHKYGSSGLADELVDVVKDWGK